MPSQLARLVSQEVNLRKVAEGKTKQIFEIAGEEGLVMIRSKDCLTAFNAERRDELAGKARIANQTTCNVFEYLKQIGVPTHFEERVSETEFVAQKCEMIPIEWVARRIATGSFLKRHPGIEEGHRFGEPKIETFYKDDANNDPQWSDEQMVASGMVGDVADVALMRAMTRLVFRVLEVSWRRERCALVDMKIEFGRVGASRAIVLADVIDNDSWRVWPGCDKRLQLDKQVYRDMQHVTLEGLTQVIRNYAKVMDITATFQIPPPITCRVLIVMGSQKDAIFARKIADEATRLGLDATMKISSAHKTTDETLRLIAEADDAMQTPTVVVAVAGRSNGLGPVIAGNSALPVINCPPPGDHLDLDIWSSLRMPAGIGCTTTIDPIEAALAAAKILASHSHIVYAKILCTQFAHQLNVYNGNREMQ